MKSWRAMVMGVAIGVLALGASAQHASAAANSGSQVPLSPRTHGRSASLTALSHTNMSPQPSRRPAPRHTNRGASRTVAHRTHSRTRSAGKAMAIANVQDRLSADVAWKILPAQSMVYINVDDLVCSGRGPPRAGPQSPLIRAPRPAQTCVPSPVVESQVVLSPSTRGPIPSPSSPQVWLEEPPSAVRHEGAAARFDLPSIGDPS
jgi:hypothetical protein